MSNNVEGGEDGLVIQMFAATTQPRWSVIGHTQYVGLL